LGDDGSIGLVWTEAGGPTVQPPARRGFGSSLIERALALETGGRAVIQYLPGGVVCEIILPPSAMVPLDVRPRAIVLELAAVAAPLPPVEAPRILVVEDSFLVIMELESMCESLGWILVGPATRLGPGLALARAEAIDAAMLDINLDGEMSWPVALALQERGIPFAFSTGYNQTNILPPALVGTPVLSKPYRTEDVERMLRKLLLKRMEAEVAALARSILPETGVVVAGSDTVVADGDETSL
jgi:CheY-like chemotaxis protein